MATNNRMDIEVRAKDRATPTLKTLESNIIRVVGAVASAVAAISTVAFPITQATEFERALADVRKTTGFTDDQIATLNDRLLEMSKTMSVTAQELANIAAIGGQLGLGKEGVDGIESFTESVGRATVTLGLAQDKAAEAAAQMISIFKIPEADVERIFSTFNELSNNSVATVDALIDVTRRLGDLAGGFENAAALAAYARELGVSAEVAGTAYATFFTKMASESEKFARIARISQQEWITLLQDDGVEALKLVAKELYKLDDVSKAQGIKSLFGAGRQGALATKIVADAANDFQKLGGLVNYANNGFEQGQSSIDEYANVMDTLTEQTKLLLNQLRAIAIDVGQSFIPTLRGYVSALQESVSSGGLQDFLQTLANNIRFVADIVVKAVSQINRLGIDWGAVANIGSLLLVFKVSKVVFGGLLSLTGSIVPKAGSAFRKFNKTIDGVANAFVSLVTTMFLYVRVQKLANSLSATGFAISAGGQLLLGGPKTGIWQKFLGILARVKDLLTGGIGRALAYMFSLKGAVIVGAFLLIYNYGRKVLELIGIIDSAEEKAAKKRYAENEERLKQLKQANENATRYLESTSKRDGVFEFDIDTSKLSEAGAELAYFNAEAKKYREELATLKSDIEAITSLEGSTEYLTEVNDQLAARVDAIGEELTQAYVDLSNTTDWQEEVKLQGRINNLLEKRAQLLDTLTRNSEFETERKIKAIEAEERLIDKLTLLGSGATTDSVDVLRDLVLQRESLEEIKELRTEIAELEKIAPEDRTQAQRDELSIKSAELVGLTGQYYAVAEEVAQSIDKLKGTGRDIVNQAITLSDDGLNKVYEGIVKVGNEKGLLNQKDQLEQAALAAYEAQLNISRIKDELRPLQTGITTFNQLGKSIQGVFDNMYSSYTSALNNYQKIVNLAEDRLKIEKDIRDANKRDVVDEVNLGLAIDKVSDKYEKRRDKITATTTDGSKRQKALLADLERKEALEKDSLERQYEARGAARELFYLQKQNADTAKEFNAFEERRVALTKEIARLSNEGGTQEEYQNAQLALADLLKDQDAYTSKVAEAAEKAGELNAVIAASDPGKSLGIPFFDPKKAETQLQELLKSTSQQNLELKVKLQPAFEGLQDAAQEGLKTEVYKSLEKELKTLETTLGEFEARLGPAFIESIKAAGTYLERNRELLNTFIAEMQALDTGIVTPELRTATAEAQLQQLADQAGKSVSAAATAAAQQLDSGVFEPIAIGIGEAIEGGSNDAFESMSKAAETRIRNIKTELLKGLTGGESAEIQFDTNLETEIDKAVADAQGRKVFWEAEVDVTKINNKVGSGSITLNNGVDTPAFARGGFVSGPGTGTSDSIPALLSNGEFVMDALTTRTFGSAFFKRLQTFARAGRAGSIKIPRFATGGPVGAPVPALPDFGAVLDSIGKGNGSTQNVMDVVELVVRDAIGDEIGRLEGSRDSVQALTDALKTMRRR